MVGFVWLAVGRGDRELDHERLDVYGVAVEFLARAYRLSRDLPRGQGELSDQLLRAAVSIVLNIAEGAGESAIKEKARFFRMAKRSANECAAVLDIAARLGFLGDDERRSNRLLLVRTVEMLTRLSQPQIRPPPTAHHQHAPLSADSS